MVIDYCFHIFRNMAIRYDHRTMTTLLKKVRTKTRLLVLRLRLKIILEYETHSLWGFREDLTNAPEIRLP